MSIYQLEAEVLSELKAEITKAEGQLLLLANKATSIPANDHSVGAEILRSITAESPRDTYASVRSVKASFSAAMSRVETKLLRFEKSLNELQSVADYLEGNTPQPMISDPAIEGAMLSIEPASVTAKSIAADINRSVAEARAELQRFAQIQSLPKGGRVVSKATHINSPIGAHARAFATMYYKQMERLFGDKPEDFSIQKSATARGMLKLLRSQTEEIKRKNLAAKVAKSNKYGGQF